MILPTKPWTDTDQFDKIIWEEKYKDKKENSNRLQENMIKEFALVLGLCSVGAMNKLEGQQGHKTLYEKRTR